MYIENRDVLSKVEKNIIRGKVLYLYFLRENILYIMYNILYRDN